MQTSRKKAPHRDVSEFILELGATEETDVRNRLDEAAHNIMKIQKGGKDVS